MRVLLRWIPLVTLALIACDQLPVSIAPARVTVLDEVAAHVPAARRWFSMVSDLTFDRAEDGSLSPRYESLHSSLVLPKDPAGQVLRPRLPSRANGTHVIALDADPSLWVSTRESTAADVPSEVIHGVVVYAGAVAGGDLLYKLTPTHADEYVYLRTPPDRLVRRARIDRGPAVGSIRETATSIEVMDMQGNARLRMTPPVARASDGERRRGTAHMDGNDVVMEIDLRGLHAPVLVDPDWSTTGTMTVGHWADTAWKMPDGRVMVVAGCALSGCPSSFAQSTCGQVLSDTEVWSESTGTWTAGSPLGTARFSFAGATLAAGDYLVAGGCTAAGCTAVTDVAERYNHTTHAWTSAGRITSPRSNLAMAALSDGSVLAVGGCDTHGCSTAADRYDPTTNTWISLAPMSDPRGFATITLLGDGRMLLVGGCSDPGCTAVLGTATLYDPHVGAWQPAGTLHDARAGHSATLLADGTVLVAGGCGDATCMRTLPTVEIWTPDATGGGAFAPGPTMPGARHNHTATTLANGDILFAGGASGATASLPTAEVYVPSGARWATVQAMHLDRAYHVGMLLDSNNVLIVGGCNPATCMPWAEVFSPTNLPTETGVDAGVMTDSGVTADAVSATDAGMEPDVWVTPASPHPVLYRNGAAHCQTDTQQELSCPQHAFPLQDPDFQPNVQSYQASTSGEVTDTATGLIWQATADAQTYDEPGAVQHCAGFATSATPAGNWRLPSVVELMTLVDYGTNSPSIDPRFANTQSSNYWTDTPVVSGDTQNWTVKFDYGEVVPFGTAHQAAVRCVHGSAILGGAPGHLRQAGPLVATPTTVRDEATGLEWQRNDDGVRRTWQDSLVYCATLNLAGETGWHLASINELRGLVEYSGTAANGAVIDPTFASTQADLYWSSTPNDGAPTLSWSVTFNLGVVDGVTVTGMAYARCVRHIDTSTAHDASTGDVASARPVSPGCQCRAGSVGAGSNAPIAAVALALAMVLHQRRRNHTRP